MQIVPQAQIPPQIAINSYLQPAAHLAAVKAAAPTVTARAIEPDTKGHATKGALDRRGQSRDQHRGQNVDVTV